MLKINNISKSFKDNKVLNNVSLDLKDGTIFGLVGVNGAGKSTLLRLISGIYRADNGSITLNDKDTYLDENIRKDLFLVSDDPYYPSSSTINSLYKFYSSFYSIDKELLDKYLDLFKLDKSKQISSFSKGMKRQVSLSFGLAIKPKLLMLDEAFDGLDPLVRHTIKNALIEYMSDNNSITIISSHSLKELEEICDSYGLIEDGTFKSYGDLLENKENINKYQVVFNDDFNEEKLKELNIYHLNKEGIVYTLIIKGNKQEVLDKLNSFNPKLLNVMNIDFNELFIYEHERGNK